MAYHSIADYIEDKLKWEHTLGRIENGEMRVLVDGNWITDKICPKPNYARAEKANPDGTKISNPCKTKNHRK